MTVLKTTSVFCSLLCTALVWGASAGAALLQPGSGPLIFGAAGDGTRTYARTDRADFAKSSFQAEVTVTVKGGGGAGCAFFGLGRGEANPGQYGEPSVAPALFCYLAPSDFAGGAVTIAGGEAGEEQATSPIGDGTHRLRLTWDATRKRAMFEICRDWDGTTFHADSSATVDAAKLDFGVDGHLFAGGENGVKFADFAVKEMSDAEIKAAGFGDSFFNDPSAGTWLPASPAEHDGIRLLACWYNGSKLAATRAFTNGAVETTASKWACSTHETPVRGEPGAMDLSATFTLTDGVANAAGVAVAFDFAVWSSSNYLLVPAVVYNGNRFHALGGGYMPGYPREMFFNPNLPLTMSDNPRLSYEPGKAAKIELLSGNASTPAMCFYAPAQKRGFIMLTEQGTRFGNNGFFAEENAAHDRISLVVSAPGVRERAANFGGFRASGDAGVNWKPGDAVSMKFRLYSFSADGIPALLDKFMTVRKALTGPNQPRQLVPMSKMSDTILPRFKARWVGNYYACENSANLQLGWVSGFMQTPLLAIDDATDRDRMCKQMDFIVRKMQGSSGFFYGGITTNGKFRADRSVDGRVLVLTRKNADALLMFFKQFAILRAQGHGDLIQPEWEQSARHLAQAFVNCWNKYGEFGQYLDPATGEIAIYNSTSGAIAPGGLALAAKYFNDPEFLRVAVASADFYYRRDVVGLGLTSGHSGDTSQDPDADSAYGFLESLMALYWATGDPAWLAKSRTVADLGATWTLSYDYQFPPQSQIAKMGGHMAGGVWASTQNKHSAPGICTASGDYLFKLYRATGEVRYADLIRDIQHAGVEATEMPGHPTCGAGAGASMERIQPTDGEGKGEIGNFYYTENAWTELDNWMMALELPGIYLQTDTDKFYVFDSIEAHVVNRGGASVTLEITNPTRYDSKVTVFAENSRDAAQPLSYTTYLRWPSVAVPSGQTIQIHVASNAQLQIN